MTIAAMNGGDAVPHSPWRPRILGAVILLLFAALQIGQSDLLVRPRLWTFDTYQRIAPRQRSSGAVAIVAVDEASLRRVGQWPWPRQYLAALFSRILEGHPAALGIDAFFPEADRMSPAAWSRQETSLPADLATRIQALPDHDTLLAAALGSGPCVLGIAGMPVAEPGGGRITPVIAHGGDPAPFLPHFDGILRSLPVIDAAAPGHGLMSDRKDGDGIVRRLALLGSSSGAIYPSLTLEMLRLAIGAGRVDIFVGSSGLRGLATGALTIPTQADGSVWLAFGRHDGTRFISASDILAGKVPAARFDRHLVLFGVTGLGLLDQPTTPVGPMPGVEIHAQFLDGVIAGHLPLRPAWAGAAETALTLAIGSALIIILPRVRLRWFGIAAVLVPVLAFGLGVAAWLWRFWLLDAAAPALGGELVFVAMLGGSLADANEQRRRLRRALEDQRLRAAKLAGELDAARRIQMGILPRAEALRGDGRFELAAAMEPARQVGGDLYDFFKIDDDRLFFAVGDVSGKGVPASLFMALGKALYKSCVLRGERDIAAIMVAANAEISRDNIEMLFITLFGAILDLRSGELFFSNAGHDAPLLLRQGEACARLDGDGGPPLCALDDFPYGAETRRLRPGDILVLTTDGITEAMNAEGKLFGQERVLAALEGAANHPQTAIDRLRASVAAFVGDAEPSDDITILAVQWHGPPAVATAP